LPAAADGQPYVELRWRYYFGAGASGARAQLRLDDIRVAKSTPVLAGRLTSLSSAAAGPWQFALEGSPHRAYTMETSTNLSTWETLDAVTLDINGVSSFVDFRSPFAPTRFYRLRLGP